MALRQKPNSSVSSGISFHPGSGNELWRSPWRGLSYPPESLQITSLTMSGGSSPSLQCIAYSSQKGLVTSPAYIVMAASDSFKDKTSRVHQMWQTDFTYLKVVHWGQYFLSTVLDDYSRDIIHWELCSSMTEKDVERSITCALDKAGLRKYERPKLLSDNGPCYKANELKEFLDRHEIKHVTGRPYHPQTQGKIERYHRSMKNVVKLDHYYSPDELRERIQKWVDYYNNHRYHEALDNVKPVDVYNGQAEKILKRRKMIKLRTINNRREINQINVNSKSIIVS